jgi:hypothetical protein
MHKLGLALALALSACSSSSRNDSRSSNLADSGGADSGCVNDADCTASSACVIGSCKAGMCQFVARAESTALPSNEQTDGDCAQLECDAEGNVKSVEDPSDVHVDGKECTDDLCEGATATNPLKAPGSTCGLNGALSCNAEGTCAGCIADAECGQPTCTRGMLSTPDCSGGACIVETESCGDYACKGGNACHESCTLQAECAPSLGCTDGKCVECVTCSEWFQGGGLGAFCDDSGSVQALFEGCGCAPAECATECASSMCGPLMPPPDATCRACLEVQCASTVSACKADVLAGTGN